MANTTLSKKHYFAQITNDVIEICDPLKEIDIIYFSYARFFNDNSCYTLTNNWESYYHHCLTQMPITTPIPRSICGERFYYMPFLDGFSHIYEQSGIYRDLFKVGQPIYFVEKYSDYFDLFIYGGVYNNVDIVNFYLNNIDLLEKFKFYFKEKANRLIQKSNNNKIIIPEIMVANFRQKNSTADDKIKNLSKQINSKTYNYAK